MLQTCFLDSLKGTFPTTYVLCTKFIKADYVEVGNNVYKQSNRACIMSIDAYIHTAESVAMC